MTRLAATTADTIHRALLGAVTRGSTDGTPLRLATVSDPALEASDAEDSWDVLSKGHLDDSRASKEHWKAIVRRLLDGVDFSKRTETEAIQRDSIAGRLVNIRQTNNSFPQEMHGG